MSRFGGLNITFSQLYKYKSVQNGVAFAKLFISFHFHKALSKTKLDRFHSKFHESSFKNWKSYVIKRYIQKFETAQTKT